MNNTIDNEWSKFMSSDNYEDESSDLENENENENAFDHNIPNMNTNEGDLNNDSPKATNIYISTKTKISYLNTEIELKKIFWLIPMIEYAKPSNGVIKKQMKFNSSLEEELNYIHEKLKDENCYEEHVITNINNPNGRIKFKDIRKVTIGVSKKDIMSCRCKKKSAFYNCIVLILRLKYENVFKEFHVKIFNTGKLEIPGIQNETSFNMILTLIIDILQPLIPDIKLSYHVSGSETVLINSNFNCGYYINREKLYDILKFNYNIQSIYDPCSYPGIQCKFYYNPDIGIQTGSQISENNKKVFHSITQVSFMIFRTGSVLIVGKCDESVLLIIYEFIKNILMTEYSKICQAVKPTTDNIVLDKKKKIRKRQIIVTVS